ncbi:MAG: VOC family protein [Vicinamibacterales bacterium]
MRGPAKPGDDTVRRLLGYLGGAWTVEVLSALGGKSLRFNELKQRIDAPANTLARVLRGLERDGFVCRFESPALARQVEYQLTPVGRSFESVVAHCRRWAISHEQVVARAQSAFDADSEPGTPEPAEGASRPAYRNLSYAGLVVPDIESAAAAWADVFDLPVPAIVDRFPIAPDGRAVAVRSAWIAFRNIGLNLIQPADRRGPFRAYLSKWGPGFHHIGFYVSGQIQHWITRLRAEGGRHVLGSLGTRYAEFDLRPVLGTGIEVVPRSVAVIHSSAYRGASGVPVSPRLVTNLTLSVKDIEAARRGYRSVFGLSMSPPQRKSFTLRTARGPQEGTALESTIRQNAIDLMVVQLETANAVKAIVDRLGSQFHLIGFRTTEPREALVARMAGKGGRLVAENPTGRYAAIDFTDRLGVVLEFRGGAGRSRR